MRKVEMPEKVDILVSELLGSFGDNEASPECLDGAMRFLKRKLTAFERDHPFISPTADGISIPSSYTAYLSPISSSKLHNEILLNTTKSSSETPYVVMFQAVNTLSGDGGGLRGTCGTKVQECWSFSHPRRDAVLNAQGTPCRRLIKDPSIITRDLGLPITNAHNTRSVRLTFHIPNAGVLHGLAGYFEAVLYRDVGLSIHPESQDQVSPGMLSWFPLFFPFKVREFMSIGSRLTSLMPRILSTYRVTANCRYLSGDSPENLGYGTNGMPNHTFRSLVHRLPKARWWLEHLQPIYIAKHSAHRLQSFSVPEFRAL
jgi:protein arginine N-methyltransferase 5